MHFSHFRQGRCWHRFWLPKLSQNGPKTVPRRSQEDPKGFSKSFLKMHAFRKGKKFEKSNFRKFRRPILSQHGSQEGSQEASKIDQKSPPHRLSLELALGRPPGPPKVVMSEPATKVVFAKTRKMSKKCPWVGFCSVLKKCLKKCRKNVLGFLFF